MLLRVCGLGAANSYLYLCVRVGVLRHAAMQFCLRPGETVHTACVLSTLPILSTLLERRRKVLASSGKGDLDVALCEHFGGCSVKVCCTVN
jgi:hypothetical protein